MRTRVSERLEVIPYVRCRLRFASLAAQAAAEGSFDCVAVDWPDFLRPILAAVLDRLPLVTALLLEQDSNCSLLSFTPSEPNCAAAWVARRRAMELACVDDPSFASGPEDCLFQPDVPLPDDDDLNLAALENYFAPLWRRMDAIWSQAPKSSRRALAARGASLAARLKPLLASGRRVLLISEYRLWWWAERQWERGETASEQSPQRQRRAALIFEDPLLLWAAGFFDEFPAVMLAFFESLAAGNLRQFDERDKLRALLGEQAQPIAGAPTTRLPGELLAGLRARMGTQPALEAARRLLSYPAPTARDAGDAVPAYLHLTSDGLREPPRSFELPDALHCAPYYQRATGERLRWFPSEERERRLEWAGWARPFITRQEAKQLSGRRGPVRFAARQDYRLHCKVCAQVRDLVRQRYPDCPPLDEYTPVAFLFRPAAESHGCGVIHDSNPTQRMIEFGNPANSDPDSPPDQVYSLAYTVRGHEEVYPPLLERELLTSLVLLYTGEEMGPDRYAAITRRPRRFQCRVSPEADLLLAPFSEDDREVAWAVQYASRAVIVVHHEGWRPSSRLAAFAFERDVRLLELPLSVLPEAIVERLQLMHYMSTPLKKHPDSERIVGRFLPPVEEADLAKARGLGVAAG